MNHRHLNRSSNSTAAYVNECSLSFSKAATIQTREDIVEKEFFTKADRGRVVDFEYKHIEKLHVGYEQVVAIFQSVGGTSRPGKL